MKCPNCGAEVRGDICEFCDSELPKKEGNTTINITNNYYAGVPNTPSQEKSPTNVKPKKKSRIIWWILGWIFIFPVPLTILMLRKKTMKPVIKYTIIAVAWIIYLIIAMSGRSGNTTSTNSGTRTTAGQTVVESSENIKGLSFSKTDDVTVKLGKSTSYGYLKVEVKSINKFSTEDVVFVSENPEVATITFSKSSSTMLFFDIAGVNGGETNVYATSKDGSVKSETIHVIVPEPIGVDAIELNGYKTELFVSETTSAKVSVSPSNAEDKTIIWTSSDEAVATVDAKGNVKAVGGGTATISASANNGVVASFDVNIDGTKTLMKLNVRHPRENDVNIGDEWSYDVQVNGERAHNEMGIAVGDTLSFYAQFTESDDNPDVGSATTTHTVTEDDIANGFVVTMDLYVTENGGRNSGKSAHFVVTYTFSPN